MFSKAHAGLDQDSREKCKTETASPVHVLMALHQVGKFFFKSVAVYLL